MWKSALTLISLCFLASCGKPKPQAGASGKLKVVVGIPPLRSVVVAVGGDKVEVSSLMSEQDDPHTFSPTPKTMAALRDTRLLLTLGLDYEKALEGKLRRQFPDLVIQNASRTLKHLPSPHHHHHHDHGHAHKEGHEHEGEHSADPHVWLSLPNLMEIADQVQVDLVEIAPEHAEFFAGRCEEYKSTLAARHKEFAQSLEAVAPRSFCVYHPAFGYFARDYGLEQKTVEIDGKAPTPRQLKELYEQARLDGFRVVFVQPQFRSAPAEEIARRIGGRVVRVNPLAGDPVSVLAAGVKALSNAE